MFRKILLSLLVVFALSLAGCTGAVVEDNTGSNNSNSINANEVNANEISATEMPATDMPKAYPGLENSNDVNANNAPALETAAPELSGNSNDSDLPATDPVEGANDNASLGTIPAETAVPPAVPLETTTPAALADIGLAHPETYDMLVQALEASGVAVSPPAAPTTYTFGTFPTARGWTLDIAGQTVYVIEFDDARTAKSVYQAWRNGGIQLMDVLQTGDEDASANNNGSANSNDNSVAVKAEHVWYSGRVLVVFFGDDAEMINRLDRLIGAAKQLPATTGLELPPAVMSAIQNYAAAQFQAAAGDVQIVSILPVEFQDSCLSLPDTDGSGSELNTNSSATQPNDCFKGPTPGWTVTVLVNGQQYTLRVSMDGSLVRQAPEGLTQ